MAPTEPIRLVPLSDTQLAEFAVNGLLVLPLSLPPAFLERFYDRSRTLVEAELDRAAVWRQIDADVNAIAADPVLQGALTSILGPDFVMPPNGTLHSGLMQDQGFHRDGVDQCVCCQRLYVSINPSLFTATNVLRSSVVRCRQLFEIIAHGKSSRLCIQLRLQSTWGRRQ